MLPAGRYLAAYEDEQYIYYVTEVPIIAKFITGSNQQSLQTGSSGIYIAKDANAPVRWGGWNMRPVNKCPFRGEPVGFTGEPGAN
jgi:hypothetical protein